MPNNQSNNVQTDNTQPQKRKPAFALLLLATVLIAEIFMAIAWFGATFSEIPWGDLVACCTFCGIIIAVWLWGYYWRDKKIPKKASDN